MTTFSHETILDLMAFADGELEGDALARVEKTLSESDEARRIVDGFRSPAVPSWLNDEVASRASAADGIADAVMGKLGDVAVADQPAPVVSLAAARERRSRVAFVAAGLGVALAAAAAVVIYMRAAGSDDAHRAPVASVSTPSVDVLPPPAPTAVAQVPPSQGVEVDEVDSPSRGVSVFEIPLAGGTAAAAQAAGPSSVVIMIEDDPGAK